MQNKNGLFVALSHHPHDLSSNDIEEIKNWALIRRYGSLTAGLATTGIYYLYTYLRHRP